jgi:hypothetical protein
MSPSVQAVKSDEVYAQFEEMVSAPFNGIRVFEADHLVADDSMAVIYAIHVRSGCKGTFAAHDAQAAATARSSAMALRGSNLFLCADTYLPTAFAMSVRHDALARMPAVFANSAISSAST